jgi:hypothetical protein
MENINYNKIIKHNMFTNLKSNTMVVEMSIQL